MSTTSSPGPAGPHVRGRRTAIHTATAAVGGIALALTLSAPVVGVALGALPTARGVFGSLPGILAGATGSYDPGDPFDALAGAGAGESSGSAGSAGSAPDSADTAGAPEPVASGDRLSLDGVDTLRVTTGRLIDITIVYGDVDAAVLNLGGAPQHWASARDGSSLELSTARGDAVERIGEVLTPGGLRRTAELTLPAARAGELSLDLTGSSGTATVAGDFATVAAEMSAGTVRFTGRAEAVTAAVDAGELTIAARDTERAHVTIGTGTARVTLTGSQPRELRADVDAGSAELTLPRGPYRVDAQADLGTISNRLETDPGSDHRVTARVGVGELTLTARDG